ncbi:hypothetical protein CW304_21865 [Bacillus sp. UFRGS-B20]|nr:hypothetical protein CW304_21865 [Bacillus sp. UFRGS-B20]
MFLFVHRTHKDSYLTKRFCAFLNFGKSRYFLFHFRIRISRSVELLSNGMVWMFKTLEFYHHI